MTLVMNQLLDAQLIEPDVEEDQSNEPEETNEETTMVLWDCVPTLELNEEDPTEEIQLSSVNVTTRSKGIVMDESSVLLKIKKMQENMKKIISTTQTTSKSDLVDLKDKVPAVSKPVKIVENKTKRIKKGLMEYDMGYDIVTLRKQK